MKCHPYIYISNQRKAITPKLVNSYKKMNNFISPHITKKIYNSKFNCYNPMPNRNYNILNNYQNETPSLNKSNNKINQMHKYSNLLYSIKSRNNRINNNENDICNDINNDIDNDDEYRPKKNISLSRIQSEIKLIEIKLTSDIIKNKINQLTAISNDSKYEVTKNRTKTQHNNNVKCNNNNNKIDNIFYKKLLIEKRKKERKIYKIRKVKVNDTDSKKVLIRKNNNNYIINDIDNTNNNYNVENSTFYKSNKKNNYFNHSYFTNNKLKLNTEQNTELSNPNKKRAYENIVKTKINKILGPKNKFKIINMKNSLEYSEQKKINNFPKSTNFIGENGYNNITDYNTNYNTNYNNNKELYNDKNNYSNYNDYKAKSCNEDIKKKTNKIKDLHNLSQGFFDNYFIHNYNIKNINNTNIYKSIDSSEKNNNSNDKNKYEIININKLKLDNDKDDKDDNISNLINKENKKKIFFENQKEKINDFAYISSTKNKRKQNNKNNSIINTVNFSFNPIKIIYDKDKGKNISHPVNVSKNNSKNINNEKTHNNPTNNMNNKNIHINNNDCYSKNDNQNKNQKNEINNVTIKDNKDYRNINNNNEKNENKQLLPIDPSELEQKAVILNKSTDDEKNNEDKNKNNNSGVVENKNKNKISFDEIKEIIQYYQNDYIKKAFVFYDNNYKKINHIFLKTKDHIQNLKRNNKKQSILLVKEDKNIIKSDKDNLALFKLNELIEEENKNSINNNKIDKIDKIKKNENNNKEDIKSDNNNKTTFIKKNINFIKQIQDNYKKGINYRCLSKREIKLLNKKKKNMCYKFRNNPQNFFSETLCDNVIKSFNLDDNDIIKLNKKKFINRELGNLKGENEIENKLNNSFNEEKMTFI